MICPRQWWVWQHSFSKVRTWATDTSNYCIHNTFQSQYFICLHSILSKVKVLHLLYTFHSQHYIFCIHSILSTPSFAYIPLSVLLFYILLYVFSFQYPVLLTVVQNEVVCLWGGGGSSWIYLVLHACMCSWIYLVLPEYSSIYLVLQVCSWILSSFACLCSWIYLVLSACMFLNLSSFALMCFLNF